MIKLALIIYYFNILAATGIVYFLLAIIYQRSKRTIINTAERPYKPNNEMVKFVFKIALVAILFFVAREFGFDKYVEIGWDWGVQFFTWTLALIGGWYHGE